MDSHRPGFTRSLQDPLLRVSLFAFLCVPLVYLLPLPIPTRLAPLAYETGLVVLLSVTVWALARRPGEEESDVERRFWGILAAAFGCWLIGTLLLFLPQQPFLGFNVLLLGFYLCFVFAAELRPDQSAAARTPNRRQRREFAVLVLPFFGLLFLTLLNDGGSVIGGSGNWTSSTYLFVVVDLYLVLRFIYLSCVCEGQRWRRIYSLLAGCAGVWLVSDLLLYLYYLEGVNLPLESAAWDVIWYSFFPMILLTAHQRGLSSRGDTPPALAKTAGASSRYWVPLVAYTFLLPLFHLLFHSLGLLEAELQRQRAAILLLYLLFLGALMFLQYRAQEADCRALDRARTEALEAKQMADAANWAKSQFLAEMSHDIRTPMNGIIGMARFLLKSHLPPREHQYAQIIKSSGEGLLRLIDEILDLSKIEAGQLTLEEVDFALRETGNEVMELLAPRATSRGVTLRFEVSRDVPVWVRGDPSRLRQVLYNLVGNAIKFTREGSVVVRAEKGRGPGTSVRFVVRDTGIGIPDQLRDRVFTPYTSTTRRSGGSGLGLANCKKIVGLMGGEIRVESTPGLGSTFWFTIPFAPSRHGPEADAAVTPARVEPDRRRLRQGYRILVAEDEWVNRIIVERVVADLGYQVHAVTNGLEALEALERESYDLVLMDCQMPEMDGYEATQRVREEETGDRHLPIVAVTASAMKEDEERCRAAGMDDFVSKPYREEELAAVLDCRLSLGDQQDEASGSAADDADSQTPLDARYIDDLRRLRTTSGQDLLTQLSEEFLTQAPEHLATLRKAYGEADRQTLVAFAHRLTGSSGALGAFHLSSLCKGLQRLAREDDLSPFPGLLDAAEEEYERVETALRELIAARAQPAPLPMQSVS